MKKASLLFILLLFSTTLGCELLEGSSETTTSSGEETADEPGVRLTMVGDFGSSSQYFKLTSAADCGGEQPPTDMDGPNHAAGEDCDEDSGVVSFVTPSTYSIAFKRVSLVNEDEELLDVIADTGTLADSQVVDFLSNDPSEIISTLSPTDLLEGNYIGVQVEIYYFQMTFPVAGVERTVRIYMSDDDFEAEGDLGHHQGDITFIDENSGFELGWVDPTWLMANLTTTRGSEQNGAGGVDAETDHERGYFGDSNFWNDETLDQGDDQDIFITVFDFPEELTLPDPDEITDLTTITMTFSVENTFYYEDFAPQGTGFFPDTGGEAAGGEWAPLAPDAELELTTAEVEE